MNSRCRGRSGFLLAQKPGLAPAWKQLGQPFNPAGETEEHLVLAPPAALAGVVVDEADKPVANAEVSVAMAVCEISREGGVRNLSIISPANPRMIVLPPARMPPAISASKIFPPMPPPRLRFRRREKLCASHRRIPRGLDSLPWRAGQEDIKLVVEPAGSIEGKIIAEGSNQPPPVARLTLQPDGPGFFGFGGREPVQSGADGAFHISDVAAGSYRIQAVFGTNAVPEWVADAVPVSVEVRTNHARRAGDCGARRFAGSSRAGKK